MTQALEDMANIGRVLAERLRAVGIETGDDLVRLGDNEAFSRLKAWSPDMACYHTRLALAGAVRGVRHTELDAELKARLKKSM